MKLKFKMNDRLKSIVSHATTHQCRKPYSYEEGKPLPKCPPMLWLIKDEGIYLCSGAHESQPDPDKKDRRMVQYAIGFDPNADKDVWDRSVDVVGGDDFIQEIPIEGLDLKDAVELIVDLTETYVELSVMKLLKAKKPKAKKKLAIPAEIATELSSPN
jgi:hypothetical protein